MERFFARRVSSMRSFEIGQHTLVYGNDGVSVMTYRGPVTCAEMQAILDTEDLAATPEVVLLICDIREAGKIDSEARRVGARSPKPAKRYFTGYVGAGFTMKVMIDMWNRATNILQGRKYICEFFDDHQAARKWLLAQKEAYEKGLA
jgi:hypothetical protein